VALAQPKPAVPPPTIVPPPAAPPGGDDTIVASVDGRQIRMSDIGRVVQTLPPSLRALPFDRLYPDLLNRVIDHAALSMAARRAGLESRPEVQRDILAATDRILEGAYLAQKAVPMVTEAAIRKRYEQLYGRRTVTEEVHLRHILVGTEAEARSIIEQLRKGADFAALARIDSKDPDADRGGDIGFVRRSDLWPSLADVAFSLAPGQVSPDPVKNEFGWHVIKVEEKRLAPTPNLDDVREDIRRELLAEAVRSVIRQAREDALIRRYNVDGTEMPMTGPGDTAATTILPH
jgi:peptidyl-prolyl cis-trans isomerase C